MIWLSVVAVLMWFCLATDGNPLSTLLLLCCLPGIVVVAIILLIADCLLDSIFSVINYAVQAETSMYGEEQR